MPDWRIDTAVSDNAWFSFFRSAAYCCLTCSNAVAPRPFHVVLSTDSSDMSVLSIVCSESLTCSNFAAVLAITADSACVWATPDVTPLSRRSAARQDPLWTGHGCDPQRIDVGHHVNPREQGSVINRLLMWTSLTVAGGHNSGKSQIVTC